MFDEGKKKIEHKMPFRDVHVARWICFFLFDEPETYAIRRGSSLRDVGYYGGARNDVCTGRRRGIPTRMKEITVRGTFAKTTTAVTRNDSEEDNTPNDGCCTNTFHYI